MLNILPAASVNNVRVPATFMECLGTKNSPTSKRNNIIHDNVNSLEMKQTPVSGFGDLIGQLSVHNIKYFTQPAVISFSIIITHSHSLSAGNSECFFYFPVRSSHFRTKSFLNCCIPLLKYSYVPFFVIVTDVLYNFDSTW